MLITPDDLRRAGICAAGARGWFATYGLDFRHFIRNGIEADTLAATGDANALRVIALKQAALDG